LLHWMHLVLQVIHLLDLELLVSQGLHYFPLGGLVLPVHLGDLVHLSHHLSLLVLLVHPGDLKNPGHLLGLLEHLWHPVVLVRLEHLEHLLRLPEPLWLLEPLGLLLLLVLLVHLLGHQ
jgi:hypothetical protein